MREASPSDPAVLKTTAIPDIGERVYHDDLFTLVSGSAPAV